MLLLQGIYQFLFLYFTPEVTILSTAINCDVSRRIDFCLHGLPHMAEQATDQSLCPFHLALTDSMDTILTRLLSHVPYRENPQEIISNSIFP